MYCPAICPKRCRFKFAGTLLNLIFNCHSVTIMSVAAAFVWCVVKPLVLNDAMFAAISLHPCMSFTRLVIILTFTNAKQRMRFLLSVGMTLLVTPLQTAPRYLRFPFFAHLVVRFEQHAGRHLSGQLTHTGCPSAHHMLMLPNKSPLLKAADNLNTSRFV